MDISLTYDPTNESSRILAPHWYLTVRHTIPERLEYAGRLLRGAVDAAYLLQLGDAFDYQREHFHATVDQLFAGACRIRAAADRLDAPQR